jgi:tRNA modification GTPase
LSAEEDTIFALASGAGRTAIAVVRVSGTGSGSLLARLCGPLPPPRRTSLRALRDGRGELLDRGMVVWYPAPGSYTGEDSAELYLHGGTAVIEGVCDALVAAGARPAEPGEFTRRAFFNGRMDLLEAEAIADLVEAESAAQRRQALRQLEGELGTLYRGWAERLTRLSAQQEALIDFPDEALPTEQEATMLAENAALLAEIERHLDDDRHGERLRDGLVFAVSGAPNAGKSTLVNALAGRDVAIVAPNPGTTRDVLEARVTFDGVPVTLLDTAGLRASEDPVETEGIRRARACVSASDLVVWVCDGSGGNLPEAGAQRRVIVASKADLGGARVGADVLVSARTGLGMDALRRRLCDEARALTETTGPPALTRARHRAALVGVAAALRQASEATHPELRGEDLRTALLDIGRITGRISPDEVLESIFGQFCIGK